MDLKLQTFLAVLQPWQVCYHDWQFCYQAWQICYSAWRICYLICSLADLLPKEMNHVGATVFKKLWCTICWGGEREKMQLGRDLSKIYLQSLKKYFRQTLVFMWNGALQEKVQLLFFSSFWLVLRIFLFCH